MRWPVTQSRLQKNVSSAWSCGASASVMKKGTIQPAPWLWQGPQLGGEGFGEGGEGDGLGAGGGEGGEGGGLGGGDGDGGGLGGGDGKGTLHSAIIPGPTHCSVLPVPHSSSHVMGHDAQLSPTLLHGGGEGEGGGGKGGGGGNGSGETSGGDGLGGGGVGGGLGAKPGGHGGGGGSGRALQVPMLKGGMPMLR